MGFNKPQGRQGAAKAATGIAPLKKYISQKAGSFKEQNRGVNQKIINKKHPRPKTKNLSKKNTSVSKDRLIQRKKRVVTDSSKKLIYSNHFKKVIPLIIHNNKSRKILNFNFPNRFHSKLFVFLNLNLFNTLFS